VCVIAVIDQSHLLVT